MNFSHHLRSSHFRDEHFCIMKIQNGKERENETERWDKTVVGKHS